MYKQALRIALQAHDGQYRKDGKTPYIIHPIRVANYFNSDLKRTIAILHDVAEDTKQDLSMFPKEVLDIIKLLTKTGDYMSYISKIAKNKIAREIKIADITDNLSDDCSEEQIKKYNKALKILIGNLC